MSGCSRRAFGDALKMHFGAPGGNRTPDLDVRTVLLYPLSYEGVDPEFTVRTLPARGRAGVTSKQIHTFLTGSVRCGTPH